MILPLEQMSRRRLLRDALREAENRLYKKTQGRLLNGGSEPTSAEKRLLTYVQHLRAEYISMLEASLRY